MKRLRCAGKQVVAAVGKVGTAEQIAQSIAWLVSPPCRVRASVQP